MLPGRGLRRANAMSTAKIPTPEGEFLLVVRFYAPTSKVLNLEYEIPPVSALD